MAIIGYARVSTQEQNLNLQLDALKKVQCDRVFEDPGVTATARRRPGFEAAMAALRRGDTFVIWKMDRAFRSAGEALRTLEKFEAKGIAFHCITEPVETQTAMGKAMYQVRNVFAELEKNMNSERTLAGLDAARRRGVKLGRPRKLSQQQVRIIRRLLKDPDIRRRDVASLYGVSVSTLSRALSDQPQGKDTGT